MLAVDPTLRTSGRGPMDQFSIVKARVEIQRWLPDVVYDGLLCLACALCSNAISTADEVLLNMPA